MAGAGRTPPWRTGARPDDALADGLLAAPVEDVARALLGARLISTVGGVRSVGVVVETEAYQGSDDPASHAATRHGRTARNATMYGPPGRAYVYRSYGVHWCLNVVTGAEGDPQAVLIRGLEPLQGEDALLTRRGGRQPLAAGPGRLCQALGVTGDLDGHDLRKAPLVLAGGWAVEDRRVEISGRVGVREAADRPLRFYVRGSPGVTRVSGVHRFSRTDRE